jgi:hypothetical protein
VGTATHNRACRLTATTILVPIVSTHPTDGSNGYCGVINEKQVTKECEITIQANSAALVNNTQTNKENGLDKYGNRNRARFCRASLETQHMALTKV